MTSEKTKPSEDILIQAAKTITGERNEHYGEPEENFALIAKLWEPYLQRRVQNKEGIAPYIEITSHDVAMMMCLLKVARTSAGKQQDNYIDLCGYAAIAGRL